MAWSQTAYRLADLDRDHRHRHGDRPPPRATRARISVRPQLADGTATVVVAGELDLTTTPVLARHLDQIMARQPRRLVIDLAQVSFIDVAAARLISGATRSLPSAGPPVLRKPSPEARRVLALTGFGALCDFE
ncbi:MAG TPA: STAS domain-containing protein [Streptosporangiaceae bacterium]